MFLENEMRYTIEPERGGFTVFDTFDNGACYGLWSKDEETVNGWAKTLYEHYKSWIARSQFARRCLAAEAERSR
jgi:hypothetical protein